MRRPPLHVQIILALIAGTLVGIAVGLWWTPGTWEALGVRDVAAFRSHAESNPPGLNDGATVVAMAARFVAEAGDFVGKLFLRVLRFVAVPVVLFLLVAAVANLGDPRKLGRMGGRTIGVFLFTGLTSATLGVALASLIQPGAAVPLEIRETLPGQDLERAATMTQQAGTLSAWQTALDVVPANPFAAMSNAQMLQVVATAILLGLGLTLIPKEKARPVIAMCEGIGEAILALVQVLMKAAPIAVFCLMAAIVANLGLHVFAALLVYCLTVVLGLAVILLGLYPAMTTLLTPRGNRVGFRRFFKAMAPAQMVAFSSSSSAATLPVTLECCRDRLGADEEVASFVCSLGVSFNMDGTALYQAVAVTFLAQLYGVDLGFAGALQVALLAAVLSIGVPGLPSASLIIMAVVLDAIGVPTEGIAVILAVDRVLDMCRTVVNVSGDAMGTAIVAGWEGKLAPDPLRQGGS